MKNQQKSKKIHKTICSIFLWISSSIVLHAQNSLTSAYQKQLIQALADGSFSETAHAVSNKLQRLDVYVELLTSLLPLDALSNSHKTLVLRELISLYEVLGRWTDVCDSYSKLQKLKNLEPAENLHYAIALLLIGEYEKCSSLLSAIPDNGEYAELKRLLRFWILYATSYQAIAIHEVEQLARSNNVYVKISALQLLSSIADEKAAQKYILSLQDITATDFSFYSGIQPYMLSFSLITAQKASAHVVVQKTESVPVSQTSDTVILQAGAFLKHENAVSLQKKLESIGITSKIVQRAKDAIFLVLIYTSMTSFQTITVKLKEVGIEAWITTEP